MAISPTQNSLKLMRERGFLCDVTERWVPGANIRKDLFGFIDILCIKKGKVVGVQCTSDSHVSDRVNKIKSHENFDRVAESSIEVVVHGWKKVNNRWHVREVTVIPKGN